MTDLRDPHDLEDRLRTSLHIYATSAVPSAPLGEVETSEAMEVVEASLGGTVAALRPARRYGGSRAGRAAMAVAAAVLIVAGAAALAQIRQRGTDQAAHTERASQVGAALPPDPPGPLYVLPTDVDHVVLRTASRWTWQLPADVTTFDLLAGRPDGSGFVDLVGISVVPWSPMSGWGADEWTTLETPVGAVHVQPSPFFQVVRQHGDLWITVSPRHADPSTDASSDAIDAAVAVLGAVQLDADGRPTLSEAAGLVVIDAYEMPADAEVTTYYEAIAGDLSYSYVVETAPGGLGLAARVADRIEPIEVGDIQAWLLQRSEGDLVRAALIWRATPNRVVAVDASTDVDADTLLAFAERLVVVSEAEWEAVFPDAEQECLVLSVDASPQECPAEPFR